MTNNDTLRQIKADYGLTSEQVAELCEVSVRTVDSWLYRAGNNMPDGSLSLLKLRLSK